MIIISYRAGKSAVVSIWLTIFTMVFPGIQPVSAQQTLQSVLDNISHGKLHKQATIGVAVYDVDNGECIAHLKKETPLVPASSLKLITTFSGLQLLGPDYVYETRITHDGFISADSTLHGNIYIEGSGDPTLGSSRIPGWPSLEELIAAMTRDIHRAGISCIEGKIIADPSVFSSHPVASSWAYADLGNYYGAGAWGLNVNENICNFYFDREGKRGRRSKLKFCEPEVPSMQVESRLTLAGAHTGDRANIYGGPFNFTRSISGTIPRGKGLYKLKGSLPDPPGLLAHKVWEALGEKDMGGYGATNHANGFVPRERRKLISNYCSPSMSEIVRHTNEMSINVYAESILKTIGWAQYKDGAEKAAIKAVEAYIGAQGLDTVQLTMHDGSGLSRKNKVTPDFMAQFLKTMAFQKNEEYLSCFLPTAGENGTVRSLLRNSPAKGYVWAKSGSMRNILSYSGYCRTASGRLVSFSVILNNQRSRRSSSFKAELEKIIDAIYRFS